MSGRRVNRPFSDTAETAIPLATNATNPISNRKILFLGAFAPLIVAVSILFRADMPSATPKGTLNCYDSAGNYEPCVTRASANQLQFNDPTIEAAEPASWTKTALYQQTILPTSVLSQQGIWPTTAVDQPANLITSAPAARRSSPPGKRPALATCGRHLIPGFFSALRRGLTHLASAAATRGSTRQETLLADTRL